MMREAGKEGARDGLPGYERGRHCPFVNPNCAVTCECGDDECHRYCLAPQREETDDGTH